MSTEHMCGKHPWIFMVLKSTIGYFGTAYKDSHVCPLCMKLSRLTTQYWINRAKEERYERQRKHG